MIDEPISFISVGADNKKSIIRVNRISFNVVGVLPEQGASGWRNRDDQIIIPIKTAMYRLRLLDLVQFLADKGLQDGEPFEKFVALVGSGGAEEGTRSRYEIWGNIEKLAILGVIYEELLYPISLSKRAVTERRGA